jgi:hypothetical protein
LPELKEKQNKVVEKRLLQYSKEKEEYKKSISMISSEGKEYLTFGGGPITVEVMG